MLFNQDVFLFYYCCQTDLCCIIEQFYLEVLCYKIRVNITSALNCVIDSGLDLSANYITSFSSNYDGNATVSSGTYREKSLR